MREIAYGIASSKGHLFLLILVLAFRFHVSFGSALATSAVQLSEEEGWLHAMTEG